MDERRREHEHLPKVAVATPTAEEISTLFAKVYGSPGVEQKNLTAWRILRCGRKELLFHLGYDQGETLLVDKEEATEHERVEGETTALYAEVKRIIEAHVRELGILYTYQLRTKNPAMLAWARGKGNDLFAWDLEVPPEKFVKDAEDGPTIFVKSFSPKVF